MLCIPRIGRTDSENTIALPKKQFKKESLAVPPNQSHCPWLSPSETILAELLTNGKLALLPSKEKEKEKEKEKKTNPQDGSSEQNEMIQSIIATVCGQDETPQTVTRRMQCSIGR
jgi:hypothetical protein